ncbi:hypothetical protein [Halobaculum sp. D14]|uniref:hypothetical protein n=1 Tax=unclassified Halobaculum TaxID=2640896 RepID=UPI003EBC2ADA
MATTACAYCGCDVTAHDPVYVREADDDPDEETPFCNYGCLAAHVDAEGLAVGTTCSVEP